MQSMVNLLLMVQSMRVLQEMQVKLLLMHLTGMHQ
jgi:hypothetical protein